MQRRKFEEANSSVAITSNKTTELPVLPRWRGLTSVTEVSYIGDKVLPRWRSLTPVTRSYLGDRGLTSVTRSYLGDTSVTEVSYLGDKLLQRDRVKLIVQLMNTGAHVDDLTTPPPPWHLYIPRHWVTLSFRLNQVLNSVLNQTSV